MLPRLVFAAAQQAHRRLLPPAEGTRAIPTPRISWNVRDFGARGDGFADDSAALEVGLGPCLLSASASRRRRCCAHHCC